MKLDIVVVEWVDAHTSHGWEGDGDASAEGAIVYTVGFLVRSSRGAITVASTSDKQGTNNARITIPRGMIKSINRLRVDSQKARHANSPTD